MVTNDWVRAGSMVIFPAARPRMTGSIDYSVVHPVPGLEKAVDYTPTEKKDPLWIGESFPSALLVEDMEVGAVLPLTTTRELSMLQFMNAVTDKENWHVKILDDEIANKWKAEAIEAARELYRRQRAGTSSAEGASRGEESDNDDDSPAAEAETNHNLAEHLVPFVPRDECSMTVPMADYCISELRYKARLFEQSAGGAVVVYNGDVVKSDTAVSPTTKATLLEAVKSLENVPEKAKDWHPGSNGKVLDLVHPSLFPIVYGRTKVLSVGSKTTTLQDCISRIGEGNTTAISEGGELNQTWYPESQKRYSAKFQWLPCEVDISGERAKITSYINNLHPAKHQALYSVIEEVITVAIPLWERTLSPLADPQFQHFQRITYEHCEYDPDPEAWDEKEAGPQGDEDDDDVWDLREDWKRDVRRVILPEPEEFSPENVVSPSPFLLKEIFKKLGRPLQVIVKLANIELTPEAPDYEGGTWHVEGQLNEHIVATALYYYSSSNITRSSLAFRQISNTDTASEFPYEQGIHDWLFDVFGCENEEPSVQEVGSVETREGRLLTFPNILQHQVQPFSLEDRTKPGHRRILALFLVDPYVRILSSAHVPPQQLDWWREELEKTGAKTKPILTDLPIELRDVVFEGVDGFPISLVEAKKLREELMEERKKFVINNRKEFEANTFSLCEH